jgi:hypothetical protein
MSGVLQSKKGAVGGCEKWFVPTAKRGGHVGVEFGLKTGLSF